MTSAYVTADRLRAVFVFALVIRRTVMHDLSFWLFAGQYKSIADQRKLLYFEK